MKEFKPKSYIRKKTIEFKGDKAEFLSHLENALYASKIVSYAQGFDLMKTTSKTYDWKLNFVNIAKIWRGGCIIRSKFLNNIMEAYNKDENLVNLIFDDFFKNAIELAIDSWRIVVSEAVKFGIPTPAMSSALFYFDSYTTAMLPTSLIQAQRDYFGAHTYERIDRDEGEFFHTNWTGKGGDTSSTTYNE